MNVHRNYGPPISGVRASPTGSDSREVCGSIRTVSGDVEVLDSLADGKVRRRKAAVGMTLRTGDNVIAAEGSASIQIGGSKRVVIVLSNSGCFLL